MKQILTLFVIGLLINGCQTGTPKSPDNSQRGKPLRPNKPTTTFSRQPLALVIGNERYEHNPLNNPVNDATDMARLLKKIGFEVTLKTDLNQRAMDEAIHEFGKRLSKSRGIGLFYYAGHGAQVKGQNYLLPIDNNRIQDETDLEYHAVYADKVLKKMEDAKTTLNIIILDACRNNPYRGGARGRRGLARMESTSDSSGSIIAFATSTGKTASDGSRNGRNGLYTSHLLRALENAYQTHQRLDDMFMQVRNAVKKESRKRQVPWYSASLSKPFCFRGCKTVVTTGGEPHVEAPIPATSPEYMSSLSATTTSRKTSPPEPGSLFRDRLQEGGEGPEMVWIPAGRFQMGNIQGGGESDERPVHEVSVAHFAMSRYEITFAEYDRFAQATRREKPDDKGWGRDNRPVINVTWHDAIAYTQWLSQQTAQQYRLPTEAEWEHAARAGTQTRYWWGNSIGAKRANCDGCGSQWDAQKTAPVGSFAANAFKLYDTSGNVGEWTCSEYEEKYTGNEQRCVNTASSLVQRGGSWLDFSSRVRSAFRDSRKPTKRLEFVGFRIVRQVEK
jgi:formylglycine-generating enzyme required for sulfatase activity